MTGSPSPAKRSCSAARSSNYYNPLVRRLRALPFPVVAAVNGVAAGAGANVALACDIVLAGKSASFVQAFAKIGLVPDSGGTWILPRLVGAGPRARRCRCWPSRCPPRKRKQWGLIWKAVGDNELMAEAIKLCDAIRGRPDLRIVADQARARCVRD